MTPTTPATPGDDELKRKFREALDRKNAKQATGQGEGSGHGKVDHAQGPRAHAKMFRRKSGG